MRACSDTLPTLTLVTPPARSLTRTRTRTFGILIPSPRVELSARVIARVQNAARSMPIDSGHHSENIPTTIDASLPSSEDDKRGGRDVRHACPPVVRAHALRHPDQRAMLRCRLCSNVFCFVVSVRNEGTGGPWCDALWSVTLFATLQGPLRSTVTKLSAALALQSLCTSLSGNKGPKSTTSSTTARRAAAQLLRRRGRSSADASWRPQDDRHASAVGDSLVDRLPAGAKARAARG